MKPAPLPLATVPSSALSPPGAGGECGPCCSEVQELLPPLPGERQHQDLWAWMFPLGGTSPSVLKLQLGFCSSFCLFVLILAC